MIATDGAWGFVYSGETGLGIGGMIVRNGEILGADFAGTTYKGTVVEDEESGLLRVELQFHVPAGVGLVGGASAQDLPMTRRLSAVVPRDFGGGAPFQAETHPGVVWLIFNRIPADTQTSFAQRFGLAISAAT